MLFTLVCVGSAVVQNTATGNEIDSALKKAQTSTGGPLYPKATETRDLRTLDGLWNFRKSPTDPETGYRAGWFEQDLDKVMSSTIAYKKYDDIISLRGITTRLVLVCRYRWINVLHVCKILRPSVLISNYLQMTKVPT